VETLIIDQSTSNDWGPSQVLAPDVSTQFGDEVTLDDSASQAFGGRNLAQFNWEYKGIGE
jgi:hypothetical protein